MAIVFIVLGGVYFISSQRKPKLVPVKISEIGIKIGQRLYPFSQISTFWIIYKPPRVATLNFRVNQGYVNDISVPLLNTDPSGVRNYLLQNLPEWEGKTESLFEVLTHLFKL